VHIYALRCGSVEQSVYFRQIFGMYDTKFRNSEAANRRLNVETRVRNPSLLSFISYHRKVQAGRDIVRNQYDAHFNELNNQYGYLLFISYTFEQQP